MSNSRVDVKESTVGDALLIATHTSELARVEQSALHVASYTGQRMMGTFTRIFCYVGAVLCALLLMVSYGDTVVGTAIIWTGCLLAIAMVWRFGSPWVMKVGLDGVRIRPIGESRVIAWREIQSVDLDTVAITQSERDREVYVVLKLSWGHEAPLRLPAWTLSPEHSRKLRDELKSRSERARTYLEPDALHAISRAARSVKAWLAALKPADGAVFRQGAIDLGAVRDAFNSGALTAKRLVECAVVLSLLGAETDREHIRELAGAVIDDDLASAIRAAANSTWDNREIEFFTGRQ